MESIQITEIPLQRESAKNQGHGADDVLDVVCIGYGATGVAAGVALHERDPNLSVLFLEQQSRKAWQPFVQLPGERMRTTFMDDLITAHNPRSDFTFVNYLHEKDQLVQFTNLADLRPSRLMYSQYLSWCADHFSDRVRYGQKVVRVEPASLEGGAVSKWRVISQDVASGKYSSTITKQVICAVGKQPKLPPTLASPTLSSRVFHASECSAALENILRPNPKSIHVAIVGDGQHAAEAYAHLHSELGNHRATWYTREPVLRPHSDTAFSSDVLRSSSLDLSQDYPPELRRQYLLNQSSPTTSHTIDLDLIESLYDLQYRQGIKQPDPSKYRFQIRPLHELTGTERLSDGRLRLLVRDLVSGTISASSEPVDMIIASTGYERTEHRRLLHSSSSLGPLLSDPQSPPTISRDYKLNFRKDAVSPGSGIWLLGSLETPDDDDDVIFKTLSARTFRLADSLIEDYRRSKQSVTATETAAAAAAAAAKL